MSGNPYFKELEVCRTTERYVVQRDVRRGLSPGKGLSLRGLVKGSKYLLFSCRPKDLDDYRAGYHHISSAFTFRGSEYKTTTAGGLTIVKADVGEGGVTRIPAHMLGLTPYDGWGDEEAPDTSFSAGKDPSARNYRGKWNHFSYVTPASKH